MLRLSLALIISHSLIDAAGDNKVDRGESGGDKTNLSNSFVSKKSTRADYLIFKGAKKGGNNFNSGSGKTKKGVKAVRGSDYLTPGAKKSFNLLRYAFI